MEIFVNLTKFSSLAALPIVNMTTAGAVSDENLIVKVITSDAPTS